MNGLYLYANNSILNLIIIILVRYDCIKKDTHVVEIQISLSKIKNYFNLIKANLTKIIL